MRSFKRSLKSIQYDKKRSTLLVLIFLVLTVLLEIIVSLHKNVNTAAENLEKSIGADLSMRKAQAAPFSYYSRNYFDLSDAEALLELNGIESLEYMTMSNVSGVTVDSVYEEYVAMSQQNAEASGEDYWTQYEGGFEEARTAGSITLIGVENLEDAWEFEKWNEQVIEGTGFTSEDADQPAAIVSERFLRRNNLEVGQEITLCDPLDESRKITLQVTGVHSSNVETNLIAFSPMNYIFIPAEQGLAFSKGKVMQVKYHTTDPGNTETLSREIEERMRQITGEDFEVHEEKLMYLMAVSPLSGIRNVCGYLLGTVLTIFILALALLTGHLLLSRRHELGIWIALGEQKLQIMLQLLWEMLIPVEAGILAGGMLIKLLEKWVGEGIAGIFPSFREAAFQANGILILWAALLAVILTAGLIVAGVELMMKKNPRELI